MTAGAQTILVIEDDPEIREGLSIVLSHEGFMVVPTANGPEALDYLGHRPPPPALILMDLFMEGMDGDAFLEKCRAEKLAPQVPVILMSAHDDLPTRAQRLQVEGYLKKPFNLSDLVETVTRQLRPAL